MSGVDCVQAMAHLDDYLKRELTPELMVEIRQHLERCRDCFKCAQFEQSFLIMLETSAARETCPNKLRARILEMLRGEVEHP
ncbi:MAG TPA: zf-HC2 domain-containing protein [Gemmatimonadales bacterium]|nr:zf-HC2 domain-containing protein [Gemmatimonadales bacterium]